VRPRTYQRTAPIGAPPPMNFPNSSTPLRGVLKMAPCELPESVQNQLAGATRASLDQPGVFGLCRCSVAVP
jgi:hypothetical protein